MLVKVKMDQKLTPKKFEIYSTDYLILFENPFFPFPVQINFELCSLPPSTSTHLLYSVKHSAHLSSMYLLFI